MVYNFFDRKSCGGDVENEIMPNQDLDEELHKPIIRKFQKQNNADLFETPYRVLILLICN